VHLKTKPFSPQIHGQPGQVYADERGSEKNAAEAALFTFH